MKCPKCSSVATKRVPTNDPDYTLGGERCLSCHYQAHFSHFLWPNGIEVVPCENATSLLTGEPLTLEMPK